MISYRMCVCVCAVVVYLAVYGVYVVVVVVGRIVYQYQKQRSSSQHRSINSATTDNGKSTCHLSAHFTLAGKLPPRADLLEHVEKVGYLSHCYSKAWDGL